LRMRRSDWGVVAVRMKAWNADSEKSPAFWAGVRTGLPEGWHIPPEPRYGEWNHWLLPVCPPTEEAAVRGIARLRSRKVGARLIYLYSPEAARPYGYAGDCPEAERLSRSVFLLPSHGGLSLRERQHTLECVALLDQPELAARDGKHRRARRSFLHRWVEGQTR